MTEKWQDEAWAQDMWYSGKVTRRRFVGWGAGAIGATVLVPAPWREAFGAESQRGYSARPTANDAQGSSTRCGRDFLGRWPVIRPAARAPA